MRKILFTLVGCLLLTSGGPLKADENYQQLKKKYEAAASEISARGLAKLMYARSKQELEGIIAALKEKLDGEAVIHFEEAQAGWFIYSQQEALFMADKEASGGSAWERLYWLFMNELTRMRTARLKRIFSRNVLKDGETQLEAY